MGLLIFSIRKQQLLRHKSDIEMRQFQLSQKLQELQSYASAIGNGQYSMNTLMDVPQSLFGRLQGFVQFSNQLAMNQANAQFNAAMTMPGAQQNLNQMTGGNAQMQQYFINSMKQQFYEKAMAQASDHEKQLLNSQEQRIQSEVDSLEKQGKMVDAELETIDKAYETDVKLAMPKY